MRFKISIIIIGAISGEIVTDEECMSTAETDWDGNKMNWYAIDDETSGKTLIKKYRKKLLPNFNYHIQHYNKCFD